MANFNVEFTDLSAAQNMINIKSAKTLNQLVDLKATGMALDYGNFGTLLTPAFQKQINDIKRGRGVFGQLLDKYATRASGHPHRWFDQFVLPNTGGFVDPRSLAPTAATNGSSLRAESYALIRALSGQINFGLFDQQVNGQSGIFPDLVAKDLADMITAIYQAQDLGLFNGDATSLIDATHNGFTPIKTQVTNKFTVTGAALIIDAIRTKVASLMNNPAVSVRPTHIFLNPMLLDLIEQEVKAAPTTLKEMIATDYEVVPGITVDAIRTVAGTLPIVPCWEMASVVNAVDATKNDYPVFIATMSQIEKAWVGSPEVQVYKLGTTNTLADQYVAVDFNSGAIVKAPTYAHAWGTVTK